jgi:putative membrane protein
MSAAEADEQEPDYRFTLANERTFLAWIRTALAFLAAGVALEALAAPMPAGLRMAVALILIGIGLYTPVQAWWGWARAERSLRTGGALPSPAASPIIVGGMVLAAVLLVIGLLS